MCFLLGFQDASVQMKPDILSHSFTKDQVSNCKALESIQTIALVYLLTELIQWVQSSTLEGDLSLTKHTLEVLFYHDLPYMKWIYVKFANNVDRAPTGYL